jgi:hypothetical protein
MKKLIPILEPIITQPNLFLAVKFSNYPLLS